MSNKSFSRKEKIAWCAGLIEGEGTFGFINQFQFGIRAGMTDLDILIYLKEYLNVGTINGPYENKSGLGKNPKSVYFLTISKQKEVISTIDKIWKYLGTRRREQILTNLGKAESRMANKSKQESWESHHNRWMNS